MLKLSIISLALGDEDGARHNGKGPEKPPWGVDMTTESDSSLTIVAVAPDGALGKSPRFFD